MTKLTKRRTKLCLHENILKNNHYHKLKRFNTKTVSDLNHQISLNTSKIQNYLGLADLIMGAHQNK